MQKIIHWFMNEMVVKNMEISSTAGFRPLVNHQVKSTISKLVSILQFKKKKDKPYLFYDCERYSVNGV